jgi:hypothetical protein
MQHRAPILISEHRLARLAAWLGAVLAWFALGAPRQTASQQRHHRRYGGVAIGRLRQAVCNLIIIRAAQLLPERTPRPWRDFASPGFRCRRNGCTNRAIGGVWLRRHLNVRGGFIAQVKHLIEALRHYRGLGAALAWRRRLGLSRLRSILMIAPEAQPVVSRCAPAVFATDSS